MTRNELARGALAAAVFAAACLAAGRGGADADASRKLYPRVREDVARADVVLLGNSVLQKGVDEDRLGELVNRKIIMLWEGGAASAWWYVTAKNAVAPASRPPQCVVLLFRDLELTTPTYRVEGTYRRNIEAMSTADEPALRRLAYGSRWEPLASLLRDGCPLYRRRDALRATIESGLQRFVTMVVLRQENNRFPRLAERVFDEDRMDETLFDRALDEAEEDGADPAADFGASVGESFLPLIMDVLSESRIPLILARARRDPRRSGDRVQELNRYFADMEAYAARRGVAFWDFSADERIRSSHFAGGDHLDSDGRAVFTRILAERLASCPAGQAKAELDATPPRGHDERP